MAIRRQGIEYSVYPPILIVSVTTTTIFERQLGHGDLRTLWALALEFIEPSTKSKTACRLTNFGTTA